MIIRDREVTTSRFQWAFIIELNRVSENLLSELSELQPLFDAAFGYAEWSSVMMTFSHCFELTDFPETINEKDFRARTPNDYGHGGVNRGFWKTDLSATELTTLENDFCQFRIALFDWARRWDLRKMWIVKHAFTTLFCWSEAERIPEYYTPERSPTYKGKGKFNLPLGKGTTFKPRSPKDYTPTYWNYLKDKKFEDYEKAEVKRFREHLQKYKESEIQRIEKLYGKKTDNFDLARVRYLAYALAARKTTKETASYFQVAYKTVQDAFNDFRKYDLPLPSKFDKKSEQTKAKNEHRRLLFNKIS